LISSIKDRSVPSEINDINFNILARLERSGLGMPKELGEDQLICISID
jgi:hypothetical protein